MLLRVAFSSALFGFAVLTSAGMSSPVRADEFDASDLLASAPQVETTSTWYLRGDGGYVVNELPDAGLRGVSQSLDDAWLFGIGVGMRAADWLRIDLTADYRTKADYALAAATADMDAATLMANAYVDLGTWHKLTPYIGAGLGAGYVGVDDIRVGGVDFGSASGWGFAWALMAGTAVELAPNWQLDLGYRYVNLDSISLGRGVPDIDQSAHEIRLGVRFLID